MSALLIAGLVVLALGTTLPHADAAQTPIRSAVVTTGKPAKPTKAEFRCLVADTELEAGQIDKARAAYMKLGEEVDCAKSAMKQVQELERACDLGSAAEAAHQHAEALAAYKRARALSPKADCAVKGVADTGPDEFSRVLQWIADALPRVPVVLAALAGIPIVGFVLLMLLGWPRIGGKRLPLERIWPFRTLLRPRITFTSIADQDVQLDGSGVQWKIGASMVAQIKERLQRFREDALSDRSPDMDLDFGSSGESIAQLVSSESPLKNALDKVGESGESAKLVTGLLNLVYTALPIRRLSISGVLGPPVDDLACATLSIENGPQLEAAVTLRHPLADLTKVTSSDYMRLVDQAAVWVQFELARALARTSLKAGPDQPDSYTRVRDGLDRYAKKDAGGARMAFEEALALYPRNWSAAIDLASTEARLIGNYGRAVEVLEHAWASLTAREGPQVKPSSFGNHYRLGYQLAAQRMHLYLSDPTRDFRSAAVAGLKPLIRHATTKRRDLHKRRNAPWLQRAILREGLDPAEERLLKFLNGALIPSAVLLLRAIEVSQGKYVNHDDVLGRIPEVLLSPGSTYRALYSLACFELAFANTAAQEAEIEPYFERALEALREAFCGAQGGSRRELGRWARRDPALGMLRESSLISGDVTYATRLQTLLDLYAVEQPGGQPAPE